MVGKATVAFIVFIAFVSAQECGIGEILLSGSCESCPDNCDECASTSTCTRCSLGFGDNGSGGCAECDFFVENCRFCSSTPALTGTELVSNGDFEDPVVSGSFQAIAPTDWTGGDRLYNNNALSNSGDQWVYLRTNRCIHQQITGLVPGQKYKLTFYCYMLNTSNLELVAFDQVSNYVCNLDDQVDWEMQEVVFTATNTKTSILFTNIGSNYASIEDVSLQAFETPECSECYTGSFINADTAQCDKCSDPNCVDCPMDSCQECRENFQIDNTSGICECPEYFYLNSYGKCRPCYDPRCSKCTETMCEDCAPGFVKNFLGGCDCRSGFFVDASGECEECSDTNCYSCNRSECFFCRPGFFLSHGKCFSGLDLLKDFCWAMINKYCSHCSQGKIWGDEKCEYYLEECSKTFNDGHCFHCNDSSIWRGSC